MSDGSMTKPLTTEERIAKIRARVAAIPSGAVTLHAPVDVPFLLATIDARDKTIAERDAEIARLRERIAKAAVYVAAHHAYRAILDAPPRARIHAQPIDERRANLEIVRAREKAHVDMIAAFDQD